MVVHGKLQNEEEDSIKPTLTIDEAVDKIYKGINMKLILAFIAAQGTNYVAGGLVLMTVFSGFTPYTEWECVSDKCYDLNITIKNRDNMCGNNLTFGEDFNWTAKRTSFSMDWRLYCGEEGKLSNISSFFFIGAWLALFMNMVIFDRIGRKNGAIVGSLISGIATIAGTWISSYEVMLLIRVIQGYGQSITYTGIFCWMVEFAPSHLRSFIGALVPIAWAIGFLVIVLVAYLIPIWNYLFLAIGIINIILTVPLLIFPNSPRFLLVRGREKEAKNTLESYSRLCNNEMSFDNFTLVYQERVQNFGQQLKDFKKFPVMLKETILCMISYFIEGALFFGFSFGWSKLNPDTYISYMYAALGNVIAFSLPIPMCSLLGKRRAVLFFLVIAFFADFLAMPYVKINDNWTLEYIACLIGSTGVGASYCVIYVFTCEIAPTSHRGMVMALSTTTARFGSFLGTYSSQLYSALDNSSIVKNTIIDNRTIPLAVFAIATLACGVAVFFLPDTTGRPIPETPMDVQERSGKRNKTKYEEVSPDMEEVHIDDNNQSLSVV